MGFGPPRPRRSSEVLSREGLANAIETRNVSRRHSTIGMLDVPNNNTFPRINKGVSECEEIIFCSNVITLIVPASTPKKNSIPLHSSDLIYIVSSRLESMGKSESQFFHPDPLKLDHYSNSQQISRSLDRSVRRSSIGSSSIPHSRSPSRVSVTMSHRNIEETGPQRSSVSSKRGSAENVVFTNNDNNTNLKSTQFKTDFLEIPSEANREKKLSGLSSLQQIPEAAMIEAKIAENENATSIQKNEKGKEN
ncbi:hypothetical protein HK096_001459 [Nowakowskiella sp. JEL0078]|nr:hypothetical protein HK096_001459 [Nowakowskiella sp. JEL0078]